MKIYTTPRPYILSFDPRGRIYPTAFPLTSEEAQRLIEAHDIVMASKNRVVLRADDGYRTTIKPATLGGGAAFTFEPEDR